MATHKSAIKRYKQSLRNQARNRAVKTRLKNVIKDVRLAVQQQDKDAAAQALRTATSLLDKASTKGVIHWKNAARKISRLARSVGSIE